MVNATVKVKNETDLDRAVLILHGQGARILMISPKTHTISIQIADEQFFNTFGQYPKIGCHAVKGPYSADLEGVEIAPKPTYF